MARIVVWAESNMGSGHHSYGSQVAKACSEAGHEVLYITSTLHRGSHFDFGKNTKFLELPEVKWDFSAGCSMTPNGIPLADDLKFQDERAELIKKAIGDFKPDAVVFDCYPYSRKENDFELVPLIEAQNQTEKPPLFISLFRDLYDTKPNGVVESTGGSLENAVQFLKNNFALTVIPGDNKLLPLDATYPDEILNNIGDLMHCVGYFLKPLPKKHDVEGLRPVVLCSGGSYNSHTDRMYKLAIDALPHTSLSKHPVKIFVTPEIWPEKENELFEYATSRLGSNFEICKDREQYSEAMVNSELSISQAGLSTVCETINADVPAILYPYSARNTTPERQEQVMRATRVAEGSSIICAYPYPESALAMASTIEEALSKHRIYKEEGRTSLKDTTDFNGSGNMLKVLNHLLGLRETGYNLDQIQDEVRSGRLTSLSHGGSVPQGRFIHDEARSGAFRG